MRQLFVDALGFAGAAMIRRTLGLAHNIDLETIEDPDLRAGCERRNLRLARELIAACPAAFPDIAAVTARAAEIERVSDPVTAGRVRRRGDAPACHTGSASSAIAQRGRRR